MKLISTFLCIVVLSRSEPLGRIEARTLPTRRIQSGKEVGETRPYMVYLKPASQSNPDLDDSYWLCGGVIIHPRYILTSAACIEDAKNFHVISGTSTWSAFNSENSCVRNGAKKAVWKCIPKDYFFDGAEFENIRWMSGDIAVVKVEDDFNFVKRVKGCDFIPKMLRYNNVSQDLEKPGTMASISGWGSSRAYGDLDLRHPTDNSPFLLETDVQIISKTNCKKRWEPRYHNIIDNSMICTNDDHDNSLMSEACISHGIDCKELEYSHENSDEMPNVSRYPFYGGSYGPPGPRPPRPPPFPYLPGSAPPYGPNAPVRPRRLMVDPKGMEVHGSWHQLANATRRYKVVTGGFCENDHGGPLIIGHGATSMVIGVISACMTKDISKKCYGPYLYTSVWNYRHLISCAIDKDIGATDTCRKAFGEVKSSQNQISEVSFDLLSLRRDN